ncbi:MAG: hypothetical protein NT085_00175 [candidate division SR1 bacterium]|nr:hypothetical protein [candidate division SR1 bacterium]
MNEAQKILNLILKMMYYDQFKSSFDFDDRDFVKRISMSSLKHFRLSSLHDKSTIFTWVSSMGESVACYANENGFYFSEVVAYKTSTKRMKDREDEKLSPEKMEIVQKEIEELKKAFRIYSENPKDIEIYFK